MMLHTKYESSSVYSLGQEDFQKFPSVSSQILQAKYESSSPYGLGQKDLKISLYISMWNLRTHNIGLISTPGP